MIKIDIYSICYFHNTNTVVNFFLLLIISVSCQIKLFGFFLSLKNKWSLMEHLYFISTFYFYDSDMDTTKADRDLDSDNG